MIGKIVKFVFGEHSLEGEILDKYMGYETIVVRHETTKETVSIEYYFIKVIEGVGKCSFYHVPCRNVKEVIKKPFEDE